MAKFKTTDLVHDLVEDVKKIKEAGEFFQSADKSKLAYSSDKKKWSVVQVLEHLNAYNRHYLPLLDKELSFIDNDNKAWFNPGFWGEKFTKMMKPKNVYKVTNKMKAMKSYSFPNSLNVDKVLKEFIDHQQKLLQLLELAKDRNLNKAVIPLTLTSLIKLRVGDALRFLIAHQQRHMIQARNTMHDTGISTEKFPVLMSVAGN